MMETAAVIKNVGWAVTLCVAAAAVMAPAPARADDPESLIKDTIQTVNEIADCLAAIHDQASAEAAKPRLSSLDQRMGSFGPRHRAIQRPSEAEEGRLAQQYGGSMIAAYQRVVDEGDRLSQAGLFNAQKVAQWRQRLEQLRSDAAAAQSSGPPPVHAAPADPPAPSPAPAAALPTGPAGSYHASTPPEASWYAPWLLGALMLAIIAACAGFLYTEGMWSNAIRLVNVITAALLATNFWEPAARYCQSSLAPSYTYFWDFLCLWGLFVVFMIVFRALTGLVSHVQMRFLKIADRIGSALLAVWIGWVMVCFTMFTLNTAPIGEYFMGGGFHPGQASFLWMAPDMQWAGFVQKMSRGPFSRGLSDDEIARYGGTDQDRDKDTAVFDRNANFIPKYAARRRALEDHIQRKKTPRVPDADVVKR